MDKWHVYLIRTRFDTLYTGIATDVARRLTEHAGRGARGSRYLRSKGPLQLVYQVAIGDHALALRAEARIRKLSRHDKDRIVSASPDAAELLSMLGLDQNQSE